ncbi:MAG: flagellar type III secretion system pore protein FliP [Planctomycetales bacterium]|nr:flagellar type III secretion system pore protein FliP [Planctomycetales bacterium]
MKPLPPIAATCTRRIGRHCAFWKRAAAIAFLIVAFGYSATSLAAEPQSLGNLPVSLNESAGQPSYIETAESPPANADSATSPAEPRLESAQPLGDEETAFALKSFEQLASAGAAKSSLQTMLMLAAFSLIPAALLMTTSFVRIAVVLGILRQAIGTQQLPSNQVVTALAMFMTLLIMSPVWKQVYDDAIQPYNDPAVELSLDEAWHRGIAPIRRFMLRQIDLAGNHDDIALFSQYAARGEAISVDTDAKSPGELPSPEPPVGLDDVPLQVLLPAFMLSELKTAFLIGFQVYLPFLILDLVVSAVTVSMGMMMLPPTMISLPFKLMLFVLVDGWRLVVGMLLESFGAVM